MKSVHIVLTLAAIGVVVSLMWPRVSVSVYRPNEIGCAANLKALYTFGRMYADRPDGYLPHGPRGSVSAFQSLADSLPEDFRPESFLCPSQDNPPGTVLDGRLVLTEASCSYRMVPWKLKPMPRWELKSDDANAMVFFDAKPCHRGGRLVVLLDGTVSRMDEDEFQARLEEERVRFALHDADETSGTLEPRSSD